MGKPKEPKTISYYEVVIRVSYRSSANEIKKRVDRYDFEKDAQIRVIKKS